MSFAGKQSEEAEEQRVALAITESIAVWLKEIKNKFKGRFPDDVRAAYRAVHQAGGFSAQATEHHMASFASVEQLNGKNVGMLVHIGCKARPIKNAQPQLLATLQHKISRQPEGSTP